MATATIFSAGRQERRARKRYPLRLEMTFREIKKFNSQHGSGTVQDFSSHGIRFTCGNCSLTKGHHVELVIAWPVLLNGKTQLKFVARGRVVRTDTDSAVVEFIKHEFRTLSAKRQLTGNFD